MEVAKVIRAYRLRYERGHDERAIFAFVYENITQDLANHLRDTKSAFDDPEWVATLTESFAAQFFKAMDAIDTWLEGSASDGHPLATERLYETTPKPWADVYLAIRNGQSYILEDLLFSMMAHISYDLPPALLEAKMEAPDRSHVRDYHKMNEVLARQTGAIQAAVASRYNRLLALLDRLAGHYDEFFTNYGIRLARSVAWYNACRLLDPSSEEEARRSTLRSAAGFIEYVRRPRAWWLRMFIGAVRLLIPHWRKWPTPAS